MFIIVIKENTKYDVFIYYWNFYLYTIIRIFNIIFYRFVIFVTDKQTSLITVMKLMLDAFMIYFI